MDKEPKDMDYDELLKLVSKKHRKELISLARTCGYDLALVGVGLINLEGINSFKRDIVILMMKHLDINHLKKQDDSMRKGVHSRNSWSG